jgi:hypothetical protein
MSETAKKIRGLSAEGYCCSQIIVKMGLDAQGDANPELLDAVAGLCSGMHLGLTCGILSGAACLLSLFDKQNAAVSMIPLLANWFEARCKEFGGCSCEAILNDNPMNRIERCPMLLEETFEKCRELLAAFGHEI